MSAEIAASEKRTQIARAEWRWVLVGTLLILFFTSIPYLLGWVLAAGGDQTFGGFVIGVDDCNSYLAKMGRGARGDWLFHIVYTSEPHDGVLLYLFYLLVGKLATLLPGSAADLPLRLIWIYHAARLVCSTGLLLIVYRFVAEFIPQRTWRRIVWLLIGLGGGLGWLLLALGQGDWLNSTPLDFILPEGFTFLVMLSLPHIALARSLLLGGLLSWLRGMERLSARLMVAAGLMWLAMGMIVPFYPLVIGMVVGTTLLLWWWQWRRFPGRQVALSLLAGVLACPIVLYSAWVFVTNPIMAGWASQNLILSPHPLHYLTAYGVPAGLALAGLRWVWRERPDSTHWLLVAWILVIPLLLYVPFNLQRRLIEGYQVPLYILAGLGARRVLSRFPRPRLALAVLLLLMLPTSLLLVAGGAISVAGQQAPIFHPAAEVELANWLTANAPEGDLVLSAYPAGNWLPAWAPVRTYFGHGSETIDFGKKRENVFRFFELETDNAWRRTLLEQNDIRFVVHGPAKRELGAFDPAGVAYLTQVFKQDEWTLYKVVP